jgi:hypothetical protein
MAKVIPIHDTAPTRLFRCGSHTLLRSVIIGATRGCFESALRLNQLQQHPARARRMHKHIAMSARSDLDVI